MTFQPLLEDVASLLGPVDLIDDLTFSSKAQVEGFACQAAGRWW